MVENYKRNFKGNVTLEEIAEKIKEAKVLMEMHWDQFWHFIL